MALKTKVKISEVTNLSDARYCAGMMVDYFGFNIDPNSPNYIGPEDFKEITDWVSGVSLVAELGTLSDLEIESQLKKYKFQLAETSNTKSLDLIKTLGLLPALDLKIDAISKLSLNKPLADLAYIKISDPEIISINENFWESIPKIKSYDVSIESIKNIDSRWAGIELSATKEDKPGFKDYGELMDILEELEEDF